MSISLLVTGVLTAAVSPVAPAPHCFSDSMSIWVKTSQSGWRRLFQDQRVSEMIASQSGWLYKNPRRTKNGMLSIFSVNSDFEIGWF
jgi:hypothetical protein